MVSLREASVVCERRSNPQLGNGDCFVAKGGLLAMTCSNAIALSHGEATLTLEARDGEQVSGSGSMAVDSFGEASYRVTAVEAEDVEYTIAFVYR
jgi:hypothetical protein